MKILITSRSFASISDKPIKMLTEKGYEIQRNNTGRPYEKEELLKLIRDVDGIIIGIDELSAEIIEKANALKVISKYGIGVDNIWYYNFVQIFRLLLDHKLKYSF